MPAFTTNMKGPQAIAALQEMSGRAEAIDNRLYPGTYASNPLTRPDGSAIQDGDRYVTTTGGEMVRSAGGWVMPGATMVDLAAPGGASLLGWIRAAVGAVARLISDKLSDHYSVFDHFTLAERVDALTGSPAIDTTAKIQAAIDGAVAAGQRIDVYGTFYTSAKIVAKGDADFSQATFLVYGTPGIALEVSTGNAANPTTRLTNAVVRLPKRIVNMTKPGTGWAGQGIGVRVVNCYDCEIHTGNVVGFATGVQVTSYGTGCVYNAFHIGHLENNKVNLQEVPGDAAGWVNENVFYDGRYSHVSGEGTAVAGTRHILISQGANVVNNNLYVKPSLEGDVAEYHVENAGSNNTLMQGRFEATTPKVLYTGANTNQGTENVILYGYKASDIVVTYSGTTGSRNQIVAARGQSVRNINVADAIRNNASSASPVWKIYEAATVPESAGSTDWAAQMSAQFLSGKRAADAAERIKLDFVNGRLYLGAGSGAATLYVGVSGSTLLFGGGWTDITPTTTNATDLGEAGLRYKRAYLSQGVGFHGATPPTAQPSVTGSRAGNAALASLLTALAACGIVADNTTA